MIKNFIIKTVIVSVLFLLNFSIANAKCKFMMDIGDRYTDSHKDKYGILYGEDDNQYAEVKFPASDFCPNDNFDDNFLITYTFIGDRLAAIQFFADNSIDNSATESMKLMKYAKRVYGDFNTGGNPQYYNNFNIWEKVQKYIVYNRKLIENIWDEEIYISNDKYYEELALYQNMSELIEPLEEEN
jgi:hypothetical protein